MKFNCELKKIPQALIDSKKKKDYEENRDKLVESANRPGAGGTP